MVKHTPTSRELQALERREQIIETALQLFAAHGYDGVSTRRIAQTAGITEGLIFHYFPTKAHLLAAVLETRHSFIGDLRELLAQAEGRSVHEVLPVIALGWLETLYHERAITSVLFSTAQTNPQVDAVLQNLIQEGVMRLASYLETRIQAGELRADLPLHNSALSFYAGLFVFHLTRQPSDPAIRDQAAREFSRDLIEVWLHGAARPPGA